jgi:hypothetical protein
MATIRGGPPSQALVGGSKMHRTSKMHQFLGIPAIAAPPKLPTKVITIAAYEERFHKSRDYRAFGPRDSLDSLSESTGEALYRL